MSVGIRFILPHDVYPRYGYLQSWTKRLFQRFKGHIESNSLDECVFSNLEEIKEAEQCLQKPIVTVFAQERSLISRLVKALVESLEPFRYEKLMSEDVSWNDFIQEGGNDREYDSKILVVIAQETDQDIFEKLSTLTQTQQENTFIYNPSTRNHQLFVQKGDGLPESESLSGDIQSVLELKVVMVLEKMASYIVPLIPRKSQEPDKSLIDYITENLKQLNISCFVELLCKDLKEQQDFIKDKSKRQEGLTQQLNSEEMQKLVELVGRRVKCMMIEYLSQMYGIHSMVTATFLDSDKFFNFEERFATWISKENICQIEAILKKCETDINSHIIPDVARFIKQKFELLEIVRIHQFELHGLLRQSNFNVDVVVETKLSPELQDELLDLQEVTGCGTVYGLLTLHASSELTQLSKHSIKQILQKYNYHKGYKVQLVTSGKHVRTHCETFDKVDNGFRLNSECVGTGDKQTCKVGTLGCFVEVKQKSSTVQQNEQSKETQTKEKIENDRICIVPERIKPCGGTIQQRENGKPSEEETISDEQNSCSDNYQQTSQENSGEKESELHCITCAHCVTDCKNVITTDDKRPFALQTDFLIEKGFRFDVALLKICKERRQDCSTHEMRITNKKGHNVVRYPWRICETSEGLASRPVYKFGGNLPHYTLGVIASDNYKTINSFNTRLGNRYTDPLHAMDPAVNIIVGSEENIPFSREGDSGSTICDRDIDKCIIEGISILHGEITENKKWVYSYSALLKPTFEKLEEEFSIKIGLPANSFPGNIDDRFEENFEQLTLQEDAVGGETMEVTKGNNTMQEEHMLQEDAVSGDTTVVTE